MRLALVLAAAGVLFTVAPSDAVAQKKQKDVITHEEIEKSGQKDLDLMTAIKVLRPHMLEMPRGTRSIGYSVVNPILVVVDGRRGDFDALTQLKALDAKEVRYLDPSRAQNEYGISANSGAIVVKLVAAEKKEKQ